MVRTREPMMTSLLNVGDARCDYNMAKRTGPQVRGRRGIPRQGGSADFHYRNEGDWLWMAELAWDIYRNNMACGSITDRAIENQLQGGFAFDPQTGDPKVDEDLKQWWREVSEDASQCDPDAELTFCEQEEIVLRSTLVPGDIFGNPMEDGTVDLVESHLCRSPSRSSKTADRIFHGVEYVPGTRRRAAYHFLKQSVDPFKQNSIRISDLQPILAWTDDGERNVFHVRFPKRAKQTRGITAYAPLFDVAGYHDDAQFLKMVQQRASSLFVFIEERASSFDPEYLAHEMNIGTDQTLSKQELVENNDRQYREVAAGSVMKTLPGATIKPWSSNVPNPEFFPHAKMLLTFMGINLGMPLVMAMMDASETNFSGYRGAVDQARMGFRKNQKRLIIRWHTPYMRFKLFKLGEEDPVFQRKINTSLNPNSRSKLNVFRHRWNPPSWPYIEPTKDATADLIRDANMLTSPRRRCRERGQEWDEIFAETVQDRSKAYRAALTEAQKIKDDFELETDIDTIAMRLAPMPTAQQTSISIQAGNETQQSSSEVGGADDDS